MTQLTVKNLDHLGMITAIIDQLGIVDYINQQLGEKDTTKINAGLVVWEDYGISLDYGVVFVSVQPRATSTETSSRRAIGDGAESVGKADSASDIALDFSMFEGDSLGCSG